MVKMRRKPMKWGEAGDECPWSGRTHRQVPTVRVLAAMVCFARVRVVMTPPTQAISWSYDTRDA